MAVERWQKTQAQGYLLHGRATPEHSNISPCVYLATELEEAKHYGPVVVEVEYLPGGGCDNYVEGCWQFRVYVRISLTAVKLVED